MRKSSQRRWPRLIACSAWILSLFVSVDSLQAQAMDLCTVTANGMTATVRPDGSFEIPNVPAGTNLIRVEAVCDLFGVKLYSVSDFFEVVEDQVIQVGLQDFTLIPPPSVVSIGATVPDPPQQTLTTKGQTAQILVTAEMSDTTQQDLTAQAQGSAYRTSNPDVLTVDPDGLVSAVGSGSAFVTIANQGTAATVSFLVSLGDPLTTVEGFVFDTAGEPVDGAEIWIFGQMFATTNSAGKFVAPNVPALNGNIVAVAVATVGIPPNEFEIGGKSLSVPAFPAGITDVGFIEVDASGLAARWVCADGIWQDETCWINLQGGDKFPNNNGTTVYDVVLPNSLNPYTVTQDVSSGLDLDSLSLDAVSTFMMSNAKVTLQTGLTNDGTILFGSGGSKRVIVIPAAAIFSGTGSIQCESTSASTTNRIDINDGGTLTNDLNHTIQGGYGDIQHLGNNEMAANFINDGTVTSNLAGRFIRFRQNPFSNVASLFVVTNNNTMVATNPDSTLEFNRVTLINNEQVTAESSGEVTFVNDTDVVNFGTLRVVSASSKIDFESTVSFDNAAGTIEAVGGGLVELRGDFSSVAQLGIFNAAGGVIRFTGSLDGGGLTWSIGPEYGDFSFGSSAQLSDVIVATPGGQIAKVEQGTAFEVTFTSVTNDGTIEIQGGALTLVGGLVNNDSLRFIGSSTNNPRVLIPQSSTISLTGSGAIQFLGTGATSNLLHLEDGSELTNGANHTIEGGYGDIRYLSQGGTLARLFNDGVILANTANRGIRFTQQDTAVGVQFEITNNNLLRSEIDATLEFSDVTLDNNGTMTTDGGDLEFSADSVFTNNASGIVEGRGDLIISATTVFSNAGLISPGIGNTPGLTGTLSVTGDLAIGTGTLGIEIGGTTPDMDFDVLAISGMATLSGTLDITLFNSFEPVVGNSFQIVTFGSRDGSMFSTINGLIIGNGNVFELNYNGADLTLTVVAQ